MQRSGNNIYVAPASQAYIYNISGSKDVGLIRCMLSASQTAYLGIQIYAGQAGWFNLRGQYITILCMIIFKKIPCYIKNLPRLLRRWPHEEAPTLRLPAY
jgi:hypothetical protein